MEGIMGTVACFCPSYKRHGLSHVRVYLLWRYVSCSAAANDALDLSL